MSVSYCYPQGAIWTKPTEPTLSDPPTDDQQAAHDAWAQQVDLAEAFAWLTLRTLTAGQIATCEITVRPCRKRCRQGYYFTDFPAAAAGRPFTPYIQDGQWLNLWCGHRTDCSCTTVMEVILPGPVARVTEVKLDGAVVDPTKYRIDNGNRLVRTDGEEWPYCQDMNADDGDGTFLVTYLQGMEPNQVINAAAGSLAGEYIKLVGGDKKCRLPAGTTAVQRQGVSYEIVSNLFGTGITGLHEVDIVILSLNPHQLKTKPKVWSPDYQPTRRTTSGR